MNYCGPKAEASSFTGCCLSSNVLSRAYAASTGSRPGPRGGSVRRQTRQTVTTFAPDILAMKGEVLARDWVNRMESSVMRTWTNDGMLVTRRMYERRLDEVFGSSVGGRVMTWARTARLVRTGKQGPSYDRPLLPRERAALILTAALVTATNLTYDEATALLLVRQDWIRHAQAVAVSGDDLVLDHAPAPALAVEVTVRNAVLRDPVLGIAAGITLAMEAA